MNKADWTGVFPAITTPFHEDGSVDEQFLAAHVRWLVDRGCRGIVALGSLGEGSTLSFAEKIRVLEVTAEALDGRVPLVAGISGLSTAGCVQLARAAAEAGAEGLLVLPPYVYNGSWRETETHFSAVITATDLSCMIYNNPVYGPDLRVPEIRELARHENVHAVKDSSGDVRRLTALREAFGERLALFAGLDDMVVECALLGADGWVAGLVNALPDESVRLFQLAQAGQVQEAWRLYEWFLPLLRFDTVPNFVQLIKLVQAQVGRGSEVVRGPRLPVAGEEREVALALIRERLAQRALVEA